MPYFTAKQKNLIIETIGDNLNSINADIVLILSDKGLSISKETVRIYRGMHYPETCNNSYLQSPFVRSALKDRRKVSTKELVEKFKMDRRNAHSLAKRINGKIDATAIPKKKSSISKVGNLTVHRML